MSLDFIITLLQNIFISLVTGIFCGLYTGLIVTRYSRFSDLRAEALRSIRIINFRNEGTTIVVTKNEDIQRLDLIAADLMFLSHKEAGSKIFQLDKEINTTIFEATNGIISYDEFKKRFSLWQNIARDIQPNKMVLWSLRFGKL